MNLTKARVPKAVLRGLTTGLGDYVDPGTPLWSLLSQNYVALEAFTLKLPPAPEKAGAWDLEGSVIESGWLFWAASRDLYGACHVGSPETNLPPKVTGFSNGVQVLAGIERFNRLSTIPELAGGTFEPRMLSVRWFPFDAFWLRSPHGDKDRFVVYSGFPPDGLDEGTAYSWPEFSKKISERARSRAKATIPKVATRSLPAPKSAKSR